ncbi:hypothetical protein HYW99_03730 [Candidatus Woesearchaeota archaeon]|nr:hypothetical protein [Candidatus Woesearchaeota archaeon]
MTDTFKADVYFDDNPSNLNDIDSLISNLSKYRFLVLEHPLLTASKYSQYKDELENYSSTGSLLMISGELTTSQGSNLVGSDFYKKSGQSESDRNSTVNASDEYLSLIAGENIVFSQAYYVENTSTALNFFIIASFNLDNKNAIAKWQYGNGTVYSFSDFSVSYFNGNFVNVIEEAAKALVQGTCNPINITGIDVNNLVKTERYLIYNSKVVKMVVYVWQ